MDERFAYDRFLVDQLIRPLINLYRVTPLGAGETPAGNPVAYVRQKRMAIKEDIRFYGDENESNEVFRIKARSIFDIGGARYDVTAADGSPIGVLEHSFGKSLFRSTWKVTDHDGGEVAIAQERSLPMVCNADGSSAAARARSRLSAQRALALGRPGRRRQGRGTVAAWARPPNGCGRSAERCSATGSRSACSVALRAAGSMSSRPRCRTSVPSAAARCFAAVRRVTRRSARRSPSTVSHAARGCGHRSSSAPRYAAAEVSS